MKLLKFATLLLGGIAVAAIQPLAAEDTGSAAQPARPWMNTALLPDKRADLILAQMTLDEKVALLHGLAGMSFGAGAPPPGAVGSAGFVPGNERLGIPALQESDASLGVTNPMMVRGPDDMSTALPSGLALASTFDPAIAYAGGKLIGNEARAKMINVQLAGGADIARDPRNGRNFEYVGEDPLLAGVMAGESVRGIQSEGVISTVKHYALNDQEHNRMTADSLIGEAAARESDLLAFELAIERGKPGSVMCSYNLVNGTYGCHDRWLLTQVLKRDWAYPGFVMSDWGAVHGVDAFTAGLDQQSAANFDKQAWLDAPLKAGLADKSIPLSRVDDAAHRVLREMFAVGLFDHAPAKAEIDFAAHAEIAQREAEDGIVLLKNRDGLLPLAASAKRIAVIGAHADAGVLSGTGSSQVTNPWRPKGQPLTTVPLATPPERTCSLLELPTIVFSDEPPESTVSTPPFMSCTPDATFPLMRNDDPFGPVPESSPPVSAVRIAFCCSTTPSAEPPEDSVSAPPEFTVSVVPVASLSIAPLARFSVPLIVMPAEAVSVAPEATLTVVPAGIVKAALRVTFALTLSTVLVPVIESVLRIVNGFVKVTVLFAESVT